MALDCVRDSGRRIYRPVVSEFDQGSGSGVDEPGTSNPNRVAVFFTCAESAEIGPFLPVRKGRKSIPFLPVRKVRFSLFYHGKKGRICPFFTCAKSAIFGGRPSVFSSVLPP
jgi:hypothetical protein